MDIFTASSKGFALCGRTPLTCVQSDLLRLALKAHARAKELKADVPAWVPATLQQLPSLTAAWPEGKAGMEINPLASTALLS